MEKKISRIGGKMIEPIVTEYSYVIPTKFEDWYNFVVTIRNMDLKSKNHWAILYNNCAWSKSEKGFRYQPLPSSRDDKFYRDTRFTLKQAKEIVSQAIKCVKIPVKNGDLKC